MLNAGVCAPGSPVERSWAAACAKSIPCALEIVPRPLYALLDQAVERFPEHRFLEFQGKVWTYAQVGHLVDRAARGLQRLGVGRGTRVGLFLPNCPYFVIGFFAALRIGATVVSYNTLYAVPEIERQVQDSGTEVMLTLDVEALLPKLKPLLDRTSLRTIVVGRLADLLPFPKSLMFPLIKRREIADVPNHRAYIWFNELIAGETPPAPEFVDPLSDVAVLQYTGGTTGVPKGAALTHYNLLANAEQMAAWHPQAVPGSERMLAVLPLFHVFAMTCAMLHSMRIGAEIVLVPRFDLANLLGTISRKRPTILPGVPTLFAAISRFPRLAKYDLSSLRLCISGGAPLPGEVRQAFEAVAGCPIVEGYGLTESPVVTCNPIGGPTRPGSIGLALPNTTIEIVSPDDRRTLLPEGEIGEICVRGPQVMAGYWRRPDETAQSLVDGRLHTGDLGYLDGDGHCFLVDRLKELIICSGYNVYPRIVEEAIYQHPAVLEAAVVGAPDGYRGETVLACIVLRPDASLSEAELLDFLKERLSPIEIPKQIEFRHSLPKSAIGKILKKELRGAGLEGDAAA
jgi:long-chain acyl-CoA synthetase